MKNKFNRIINYIIIFIFIWIIINTFFKESSVFYHVNPYIGMICGIVMVTIWGLIYHFLNKTKEIKLKKEIIIVSILFLIIIGIQVLVILNFRAGPAWDFGVIYENARNFALHGDRGFIDYYYEYFSLYPNNIMMFILLVPIIKIGSLFGVFYTLPCIVSNVILIDLSILFLYLYLRKKTNIKTAIFGIIVIMCFTPIYLYSSIFYTDTFSMPFAILMLYLSTFIPKEYKNDKKNILLLILFGIIFFIGYKLKATLIFFVFALILVKLLNTGIKKSYKQLIWIFGTFLVSTLIFNVAIVNNKKLDFKANNNWGSIPVTHWIMMGIENPDVSNKDRNAYGGYNEEDFISTKSQKTRKKAVSYNIDEYFRRFKKYGFVGYLDYLTKKAVNAWTDGLYHANIKLLFYKPVNPDNPNRKFIDHEKDEFKYLEYTSQATQIGLLLIIVISSILEIKKKKYSDDTLLIKVTLILLFGFFLFWENRSRYLVNYIPIFALLISLSYYKFLNKNKEAQGE